jgi:hypothetical protein
MKFKYFSARDINLKSRRINDLTCNSTGVIVLHDNFLEFIFTGRQVRECTTSSFLDMCADYLSAKCERVGVNIVQNVTMNEEMTKYVIVGNFKGISRKICTCRRHEGISGEV